ncbi:MAG: Haloacid dehalogenase-like hydrolase [Ferruginibacter sp.]|nr:Haloacid dehalogenase-like hydrolase [Ferruginibacter sp.]
MLNNFKVILWDFDGVLMNSNAIRGMGFEKVLADYPVEQVAALMNFHELNGGLSRYVKFRYFFEEIRKEKITDEQVVELAERFSVIMKKLLFNSALLIDDSIKFVKQNAGKFRMHIVSGSDGTELNALCAFLEISQYFYTIQGSPTPKNQLVEQLLTNNKYPLEQCVLIGDSINDLEAAKINNISFAAYNNPTLFSPDIINIEQFYQ